MSQDREPIPVTRHLKSTRSNNKNENIENIFTPVYERPTPSIRINVISDDNPRLKK